MLFTPVFSATNHSTRHEHSYAILRIATVLAGAATSRTENRERSGFARTTKGKNKNMKTPHVKLIHAVAFATRFYLLLNNVRLLWAFPRDASG